MSRTVVAILRRQGEASKEFAIYLAEPNPADAWSVELIEYDPAHGIPGQYGERRATNEAIGQLLMTKLVTHAAIGQRLNSFATMPPNEPRPLFVLLNKTAEGIPWETLFVNGTFLALDRLSPITRIAIEADPAERVADFQPPLRILAVLSAAGVPAKPEWEALRDALKDAPFLVALKVFVAEPQLLADLSKVGQIGNLLVVAESVPAGRDLPKKIIEFKPSILHFFCHGDAGGGFPQLRIATISTWNDAKDEQTVVLEPDSLATSAIVDPLWLVTLNCCESAKPGAGPGSFAYSLVTRGVPAVMAMRETVDSWAANAFARGLYSSLIQSLTDLQQSVEPAEVDFPSTLWQPRMEIFTAHGDLDWRDVAPSLREWTLPALYVGKGQFKLRYRPPQAGPALDEEERIKQETTLRILKAFVPPPGTPPSAVEDFKSTIARLEAQLYGG